MPMNSESSRPNRPDLRGRRGISLVEILITLVVTNVIMVTFVTLTGSQYKQSQQMQEKLAALDVQRTLTGILQDGTVCTYVVGAARPPAFDPTVYNSVGPHLFLNLPSLPSKASATADLIVVADGKSSASAINDAVVVRSIAIDDVTCDPSPCVPTTSDFTANITVNFDPDRLVIPLRPLKFPINLKANGTAGAQVVTACQGRVTLDTRVITSTVESCGGGLPNCMDPILDSTALCPNGYQLTGCGRMLSTWAPRNNVAGNDKTNLHVNSPNNVERDGTNNGCKVYAGATPGCGVCFKAQAFCIKTH